MHRIESCDVTSPLVPHRPDPVLCCAVLCCALRFGGTTQSTLDLARTLLFSLITKIGNSPSDLCDAEGYTVAVCWKKYDLSLPLSLSLSLSPKIFLYLFICLFLKSSLPFSHPFPALALLESHSKVPMSGWGPKLTVGR